ncbi:hypothetical protein [Azospirillum formosense]|uniref:hypothetical protein n=1 Tax=Azospirillum formosense TaxID=861533 RepID=UPI00338F0988
MSLTATETITANQDLGPSAHGASAVSTPRVSRGGFLWEVVKMTVAAAAFAAILLPLAFPSRAGTGKPEPQRAEAQKVETQKPVKKLAAKSI